MLQKLAFSVLAASTLLAPLAHAQYGASVYVRGYVRSDGIYVPGHLRSAPDGNS